MHIESCWLTQSHREAHSKHGHRRWVCDCCKFGKGWCWERNIQETSHKERGRRSYSKQLKLGKEDRRHQTKVRSDNKGDLWHWYWPDCFFFLWSNCNIRINGIWPNLVQHHEILTTEELINVSSWRHYNFFSWLLSINETNRHRRSRRKSSSNRPECQNCDKSC